MIILAGLALFALADTQPTYLKCTINGAKGPVENLLLADEANQSVTLTVTLTGHSEKMFAVFSPEEVSFQSKIGGVATVTTTINRVNLSVTRTLVIGTTPPRTDTGSCTVEKAPKRAF